MASLTAPAMYANGSGRRHVGILLAAAVAFSAVHTSSAAADPPGEESMTRVHTRSTVRSNSTVGGPTLASSMSQNSVGWYIDADESTGVLPRVQKINDFKVLHEASDEESQGPESSSSVGLRMYEESDSDTGLSTPQQADPEQRDLPAARGTPVSGVAGASQNLLAPQSPGMGSMLDFAKGFNNHFAQELADRLREFEDAEPLVTKSDGTEAAADDAARPPKMRRIERQFDLSQFAAPESPRHPSPATDAANAPVGWPSDDESDAGGRSPSPVTANGPFRWVFAAVETGSSAAGHAKASGVAARASRQHASVLDFAAAYASAGGLVLGLAGGVVVLLSLRLRRGPQRQHARAAGLVAGDASPAALEMGLVGESPTAM